MLSHFVECNGSNEVADFCLLLHISESMHTEHAEHGVLDENAEVPKDVHAA